MLMSASPSPHTTLAHLSDTSSKVRWTYLEWLNHNCARVGKCKCSTELLFYDIFFRKPHILFSFRQAHARMQLILSTAECEIKRHQIYLTVVINTKYSFPPPFAQVAQQSTYNLVAIVTVTFHIWVASSQSLLHFGPSPVITNSECRHLPTSRYLLHPFHHDITQAVILQAVQILSELLAPPLLILAKNASSASRLIDSAYPSPML